MQGCRRHVQDTHSGDRRLGWRRNGEGAASSVVRSVRRKCRAGSSSRQPVSREKEASRGDSRASRTNLTFTALVGVAVFTCQLIESYLTAVCRCATCAMGMMGMFKWLRKDTIRDRNGWNLTQKQYGLNNESYRNALQAFIDRRRSSNDVEIETSNSPDKLRADLSSKNNNNKCDNKWKSQELKSIIPGVPHIAAPEIFEIGWIAGTEDRYLELIFAEWQNTRVSLKRHSHPECKDAVKADLDILSEIRHPNVLLLMATTFTDDHGLVSIFESVDCTLYHYMHDQGERISMQGIAKCGGRLSDALRHSHMRGYVHTAISSHCVYLASNGIIKLGGWELAMHINNPKPKREYEERLRAEVFRWQAPELFHGYEPYKESDVYGLALLIWEMCTMHVPWNGYNKADVERQYVHWKRGVIMDLYNFPPLLYNLLEAGLQLDVNKRTLDMNRMRRFLQKLELQYENVEPVYIDQYMNNNNEILQKTYILQKKSPISKNKKLFRSLSTKQLSYSSKNADSPSKQHLHLKKSMSKQTLNQESHDEEMDFFVDDIKGNTRNDIKKNTNIFNNLHNNCKKSDYPTYIKKIPDIIQNEEESNAKEILQPWNSTYKKVKAPQEMGESRTTSMYSSPLLESTDDESFKDARTNLKQLKKVLASKREHFFYGSDSSPVSTDISPTIRDKIFTEIKSKDYEPHKPASHRTSIEPKCNKSPNQYDSSYLKSTFQSYRKIPYLHTPETIKDAIIQPQILNSDPQSFFETSLWRKEKLICLSKMRRICADESPRYLAQQTDESDTISVETVTKNQTTESISINSDNTYVIKSKTEATETETSQEGLTQVSENMNNSITPSQNEPLQILKDALDRATKIVRSITPNTNELCQSPTFRSYQDFEVIGDNNQDNKYIFENLYDLQVNDDNEEIKNIERSITKNKTFLFNESNIDNAIINDETQKKPNNLDVSIASIETCTRSYNTTCSRNFICECIAEVSNEFNNSYNDTISKKEKIESSNDEIIIIEDNANSLEVQNGISQNNYDTKLKIKGNEPKSIITNFDLMFINDTPNNKNCKTCYQSTLPRRRSLPATLSQLRTINNSALGKLPIRRGDIPDNTIEDLYIDDEFGDSLNVNMVLLHENLPIDEDFLSEISNL